MGMGMRMGMGMEMGMRMEMQMGKSMEKWEGERVGVGVRGVAANLAYCGGLACSYNVHNLLNAQQEQTDRGGKL